jgi:Flp pilus assembly protein TadB
VIRTGGSLRALKRAAVELERRRERRRGLIIHLVIMFAMAGIAAVAAMLDWALTIPAVIGVFAIALKTLVMWVETATGNAWSVLSEHYQ